jgi:hypothetical protein
LGSGGIACSSDHDEQIQSKPLDMIKSFVLAFDEKDELRLLSEDQG